MCDKGLMREGGWREIKADGLGTPDSFREIRWATLPLGGGATKVRTRRSATECSVSGFVPSIPPHAERFPSLCKCGFALPIPFGIKVPSPAISS